MVYRQNVSLVGTAVEGELDGVDGITQNREVTRLGIDCDDFLGPQHAHQVIELVECIDVSRSWLKALQRVRVLTEQEIAKMPTPIAKQICELALLLQQSG